MKPWVRPDWGELGKRGGSKNEEEEAGGSDPENSYVQSEHGSQNHAEIGMETIVLSAQKMEKPRKA